MMRDLVAPDLAEMLHAKRTDEARAAMSELLDPELADVIASLDSDDKVIAFRLLSRARQGSVFSLQQPDEQEQLLEVLSDEHLTELMEGLAPDDRATLMEEMPGEVTARLLATMRPDTRRRTQFLLGYPEESVGRLMTPYYLTVKPEWTVEQAIAHFRQFGRDAETFTYVYVVDDHGVLLDDLRIRVFVLSEPTTKVRSLMDENFVALRATDDREAAVRTMERHDTFALPVVNDEGVMVGIVTADDVADVARAEATEDAQKMGGVEALSEPYLSVSLFELARKRGSWLSVLFVGEMLTASAMGRFQHQIEQASVLALFVPLIISSGGNSGSQASTLIIRAIAVGEVSLKQWWHVMRRELACGILLGLLLGALGLVRIHLWQWMGWVDYTIQHGDHVSSYHMVAIAVSVSLIGVVLWGTIMGAMLPFLLKALRLDPATISAPFVATLVDVTGLVIYFTTAVMILHNTVHW
ncbi:MAG: magnesium transporter [Phycisphaera sp.]|nr:magnesium transporter [Phycisphaera sp.]